MTTTPDIAGFIEAQEHLRRDLGTDVVFRIPVAPVWPPGTPLDPQTGRPHDPTVQPQSGGGFTTVTRRVGLVFRPIHVNVEDPVGGDVSGGIRSEASIAMTISTADWVGAELSTQVRVGDVEFKVTQVIDDPGLDDRVIIFAEAR